MCDGVCVCVCVCVILFSVIIICNTVYIFTFNCYAQFHFSLERGGWVGAVCTFLVSVSFGSFLACESLHVCTVRIWRCEHARFCLEVFYALYINFHSFTHIIGRGPGCLGKSPRAGSELRAV